MFQPANIAPAPAEPAVQVWDRWVRLFHWSLVLAIAVAAVTGFLADASWLRIHIAGGLAALALVLMRIIWGLLGPTHARFSDFVPRPAAVLSHLKGRAKMRHLGHNPLGALMVLALLLVVLSLGVTGIAMLGGLLKAGPLAFALSFETASLLAEIHEAIAFGLLGLIVLHLAGVAFESRKSRENLARAMLTGVKELGSGDHRPELRKAHGGLALLAIGAMAAGLFAANAALSSRPVPGLPVATLAMDYSSECGACHMAYHPSLLRADTWAALMARLEDHFGEDARLDAQTAGNITSWLTANAAETADTRPARRIAHTTLGAPFDLTQSPFWKLTHAGLDPDLFKMRAVASRANCAACHRDAASGFFSPFAIIIPEETTP